MAASAIRSQGRSWRIGDAGGGTGGAFTRAKLMVYLVAFQNGFFWKKLFEQRRRALSDAR
jgi:hypothetical protein